MQLIENMLHLCIRRVLADAWLDAPASPDRQKLEDKRLAESKRRDGAVTSDLLEYAETYRLTGIVLENWEVLKPVLTDRKRTEVCFSQVGDVRNSYRHSRTLMTFEQNLPSGSLDRSGNRYPGSDATLTNQRCPNR